MNKLKILFVGMMMVALSACAQTVHIPIEVVPIEDQSGFFFGLWNGLTVFPSFIGSLFWDNIAVYDVNNNGGWYDFGYVLGVGGFSFGVHETGK